MTRLDEVSINMRESEMIKSQDEWLIQWSKKRQRGLVYYTLRQTIIIAGAYLLGKFIAVALFTNQSQWEEFFTSLPMTLILLLAIGIPLNVIFWFLSERRYQRLSNKQKST